jgi:predicted dehydrogenase
MLRIGIVGCGKIADAHASQIRRIPHCQIVAVCDTEELMAAQLADRFEIKHHFSDVSSFLKNAGPDVVHITTPPQSHFTLATLCIDAGCHVYLEKPFTLNTREAISLIHTAETHHRKVTVGHDDQFTHAARRMRALIAAGYLGGPPLHMESHYCYNLDSQGYATALLADKSHWVRQLPGRLLHNVISHGIAKISEFLESDNPTVIAHGFTSPFLSRRDEIEIVDELRVMVKDASARTAYFTFSSQLRPSLHTFRIFGPRNGLLVDHDHQTVIRLTGSKHKSYLETFVPPVVLAHQYLANSLWNIRQFLRNDFHMKSGMKFLIESFYRSITNDTPLPISYKEIVRTAKIMDAIFAQVYSQSTCTDAPEMITASLQAS